MECESRRRGSHRPGEGGGGGWNERGVCEDGWTLNNDVGCQGMCPLPVRLARGCFQVMGTMKCIHLFVKTSIAGFRKYITYFFFLHNSILCMAEKYLRPYFRSIFFFSARGYTNS